MMSWKFLFLLPLLGCTACASIVSGSNQPLAVTSDPPQARCELTRDGAVVAGIPDTPGSAVISKSGRAIVAHCAKDGYVDGTTTLASQPNPWVFGNLLFGGLVGVGIDAATGAYAKYPEQVNVVLNKAAEPPLNDDPRPLVLSPDQPDSSAPVGRAAPAVEEPSMRPLAGPIS